MRLGQPEPGFANRSLALVESTWTSVTMVTCDTTRMLMQPVCFGLGIDETQESGW